MMNALLNEPAQDLTIEAEAVAFARHAARMALCPFAAGDTSTGMEYELQVAVEGEHEAVDLPLVIAGSTFFRNTAKRAARGDLPRSSIDSLRDFIANNATRVWENSWIRLAEDRLCSFARKQLKHDLLADKSHPDGRQREDVHRFSVTVNDRTLLRLPISYLLKLALADAIGRSASISPVLFKTGRDLLSHFLSDNTSPEILSFTIPVAADGQVGRLAARETARTFLFGQLLVQYANRTLGLAESGQKCLLYNAPHAPYRQKKLNEIVPDGFYRHLFMSPCLSGWDRGEEKHQYMALCHRTLSRSQLNTIGKLKDAGIITNNLVTLPNTSNTCLANNGTHVSLGSKMLSSLAGREGSGFSPRVEKHLGDLVIKIVEHFLPLFVTTYTAAPYRIDFADFHPEKVLGFLPHELDYTHLRMLWRRWQKKASLGFLGHTFTPFGPRPFDTLLARCFGLHGDLVPDFRLIDYLVTLLSTETSPALDGQPGNQLRLKQELAELGVFDQRMAMYLPYRQREFRTSGYAGFEGRSYSLFPSLLDDMTGAIDLQNLITALAYQYIIGEEISHRDIPDSPSVESERRQIFFGTAIGIPTFFVRADSPNRFLRKILGFVREQRHSHRYKGYIRIKVDEYRLALLAVIEQDGKKLLANLGLAETITDLRHRLTNPSATALNRLIGGAMEMAGGRKNPHKLPADGYNSASEQYYRKTLRNRHSEEGLTVLIDDCQRLEKAGDPHLRQLVAGIGGDCSAAQYISRNSVALLTEQAGPDILDNLLQICLAVIHADRNHYR